jgi:crossover junction endodeoxyribonuclease RusA
MRLEFVVLGPPVSNQSKNVAHLTVWRVKVQGEAKKAWANPPLKGKLKAIIINFHVGDKPPVDVGNMSKPIHDVMNNLIYDDDPHL